MAIPDLPLAFGCNRHVTIFESHGTHNVAMVKAQPSAQGLSASVWIHEMKRWCDLVLRTKP